LRQMKDSRVEWIGEIPIGWQVSRIKELFAEVNERCSNGADYTLLSVSEYYGVAPKAEKISEEDMLTHAETLDGYKICQPNDIVMNIMLAWKRALGASRYKGIISPAYCVYRPREGVCSRYFHYLYRTDVYANLFKQYSTGIIDSRLRLYPDKFLALKCQVPPMDVQQRIIEFLDIRCAKIDSVIARQQEAIEKLKAYKLSVVTEAVTQGLNPDVPMKDSGYHFIGTIPKHWTAMRMKHIAVAIGDGIHTTPEYDVDGDYYFLNGNNIGADSLVFKENTDRLSIQEYQKYKAPLLNEETIFITLNGATYGKTSFYHGEKVLLGKSAGYITLNGVVNKSYIRYYLQSRVARTIMELSLCGSTIANLSLKTLNNFYIPLPGRDEQDTITTYLDQRCAQIDSIISRRQSIIDKLVEYKKSLIYEVVTGKREV